ncbi:MAG: calcium-binding protein, partial [Comamonadaceae bacterium]
GLGDDVLAGAGGLDTLDGGTGNDTAVLEGSRAHYTVTRTVNGTVANTVLTHTADATEVITVRGVETFQFADQSVALADLIAHTPSDLGDALVGTDGADTLDGYKGNDTMTGLAGNDTYLVDAVGDQIIETEGGGTDTALITLATGTYTLGAHVERGTVAGTGAAGITGNALANRLTGNAAANALTGGAGDDILDGGQGADRLAGGTGNDTYIISTSTDVVTEAVGEGDDTVQVAFTAAGTYVLAAKVERATLSFRADLFFTDSVLAINLTGNTQDNTLIGGSGNNVLSGGLGNDTLVGIWGRDTVDGGADEDTLILSGTWRDYTITRTATDTVFRSGTEVVTARNVETFRFADASLLWEDIITTASSDANDRLVGTNYADRLSGGKGNDTLQGMA